MTTPLASVRRFFGRDVRRALVATPLRRFLVYAQWMAAFGAALIFNSSAPWWAWLLVGALEVAALAWIGDRLADRDALRADEAQAKRAERRIALRHPSPKPIPQRAESEGV